MQFDFEQLNFDNRFVRELPPDPISENSRRQVLGACYSRVQPTPVAKPRLVAYAREVAQLLDIGEFDDADFAGIFSGNEVLAGMDPFAMCYGGHQFGNWAGQLGDGRAINLAEVVNRDKERWMIQLKGAGPTPYSRTADGLAVLRSSVREFLCSEAMHHLGVPTTRALSLVVTGEQVRRDMFYDGNPKMEPGAIVCRVAPSFTRFGNFQLPASRGDVELLRTLADYTIRTDFPHLCASKSQPTTNEPGEKDPIAVETYAEWFREVCQTTADMVVHWMRVGFVHGVMNTDNMSILGLTIDYGPYGWLEGFDPNWTPNTTDAHGRRYRFGHQPQIAMWNLHQLANALVPLTSDSQPFEEGLAAYAKRFNDGWQTMIASKLGLGAYRSETDEELVDDLMAILQLVETDMTIFYRRLAELPLESMTADLGDEEWFRPMRDAYYAPEELTGEQRQKIADWLRSYQLRIQQDGTADERRRLSMNQVNPKYVLRNYLAQLAIDKAEQEGDDSMINELLDVLRNPYSEQPQFDRYAEKRPDWARHRPGCSMLSCSS